MLTIGVAIAIPEPHGSLLRRKRAGFGDSLAATVPSHVTLMPPLDVAASRLDGLCDTLQQTAGRLSPFEMRLNGTGTFRPVSPVVYVTVEEGFAHADAVATAVRSTLCAPDAEFPFHPHVTVAHHLDDAALDRAQHALSDFDCSFRVDSIYLYLHKRVEGWTPTRAFALGTGV